MKEKSRNRRSKAYDELKKRIIFGHYKPGSTLDEKRICQEFRISRTPYREALMRLEAERLVLIKPKTGVVVPPIDLNSLKDVFEMRTVLEAVAARMAFKRIQPHQLEALKKVAREVRSLSEKEEIFAYLELDAQFHAIIHSAQGNQVLKENLDTLYNQCMRLWNSIEDQELIKRLIVSSVRDIAKIYDAFVAGDGPGVERGIKQHFATYLHTLIAHLIGGLGDEFVPSEE
jgi:GntR family transcriptional regulator, rspAB operon transcriptional repressor